MEGCRVYDDSPVTNVLLKNERIPCTSPVLDSVWGPNSSSSFPGSVSMVNFEDVRGEHNTERPFFGQIDSKVENCDEGFDGCFHQPEKKRRLKLEQVQFLEKSFEVENKLEPDRKVKLAKELGLQPRQVAIWFQNRRARYKTKLLEKEYDSLKASYDKLKADYDTLCLDNDKLKSEVHLLSQKLLLRENGKPKPEPCDPISPVDHQPTNGKPKPEPCDPTSPMDHPPKNRVLSPNDKSNVVPVVSCKQEDASSSGRSDLLDSDSPHYTDGNHSAVLEPAHSSHVFEPDLSDFSQDEDDSLLRSSCFPKLEFECCDDLQPNSCDFGFPVQDQGTWFWQY